MRYRVTFRTERCKGCGLCAEFCPKNLIAIDMTSLNRSGVYPATIKGQEACIGCCSCALMCPDNVIEIEKQEI